MKRIIAVSPTKSGLEQELALRLSTFEEGGGFVKTKGRAGGQHLYGGVRPGDTLILEGSTHAVKGRVITNAAHEIVGDLTVDTLEQANTLTSFLVETNGLMKKREKVAEDALSLSNVTTWNATTSMHGFLPMLSNDATQFMSGIGTWVEHNDKTLHTDDVICQVAWTDYSATSTIIGFSAFSKKQIFYKKIGKTVIVMFNIEGTGDSATINFTVPYTATGDPDYIPNMLRAFNAGVALDTAWSEIAGGTSTVHCYRDGAATAWTAVGGPDNRVLGTVIYEAST